MKALLLLLGSIIGLPLIAVISFGIQFIIGLGLVASAVSEYDQTHKMLAHSSRSGKYLVFQCARCLAVAEPNSKGNNGHARARGVCNISATAVG